MKKLSILGLLVMAFSVSFAQSENPVHWKCRSKKVKKNMYELHFTATIDQPYHIYAQVNDKEIALPTKVTFSANQLTDFQGKVTEVGKMESRKEKLSGETINYYADEVDFVQLVKLKPGVKTRIKGYIDYMACTNEHCLPQANQVFSISVGP